MMAYAGTRAIQFVARRLRRQAVQLCFYFPFLPVDRIVRVTTLKSATDNFPHSDQRPLGQTTHICAKRPYVESLVAAS